MRYFLSDQCNKLTGMTKLIDKIALLYIADIRGVGQYVRAHIVRHKCLDCIWDPLIYQHFIWLSDAALTYLRVEST